MTAAALLFATFCFVRPASAQSASGNIQDLQRRVEALEKKEAASPASLKYVRSAAQKLEISAYVQMLYEFVEQGRTSAGAVVPQKSGLSIERVRLYLRGELAPKTRFQLQLGGDKGADARVLDAMADFRHLDPYVRLTAGQWNPEDFGSQAPKWWHFASGDNSGDTMLWADRDRGVEASGRLADGKLAYFVGLFNGNGIGSGSNGADDNTDKRLQALLYLEPYGEFGHEPSDLKHGPLRAQWGVLGARSRSPDAAIGHQDLTWTGGSFAVRGAGAFFKTFFVHLDVDNPLGARRDQGYFSAQAGYVVPLSWGHQWEPVARFERLDANEDAADAEKTWLRLGFNYYIDRFASRVKANYLIKRERGASRVNNDSAQILYQWMF